MEKRKDQRWSRKNARRPNLDFPNAAMAEGEINSGWPTFGTATRERPRHVDGGPEPAGLWSQERVSGNPNKFNFGQGRAC